jgi:hypothetical protein
MSEFLKFALAAHGGLDRRDKLRSIRATLSVSGALLASKGRAGQLEGIEIEAQLHEQKVVTYIATKKKRWVFQPNSIVVEADSGEKLAEHFYPRRSFQGNSVDVLRGAKGLNYPSDYRDFNGILLPIKRRVYPVDIRRQKVAEPVLVAIDLFEVTIQ